MKKNIFPVIIFLCLLIISCNEAVIDNDDIYIITFYPNGGNVSGTTNIVEMETFGNAVMVGRIQTDTKGRISHLPTAEREGYGFTGWFTTGGTQVSLQTVFHHNTTVIAQWGNGDVEDTVGPLAQQLDIFRDLSSHIRPDVFTFNVTESENISPQTLIFEERNDNIEITIRGITLVPPELFLSGFGSIFTVGKGTTLILENIRLSGRERNISSLIVVEEGGKVIINSGTFIVNNGNESQNFGGGVTVNIGGEFIMNGGEINENSSYYPQDYFGAGAGGGGVLVRGGAFTMNGGRFFENVAAGGGAVMVRRGGTFTMNNGEIHRNIAREGGGVRIYGDRLVNGVTQRSTFVMNNGKIHENEASGGGVAIGYGGTFDMVNGEISQNMGSEAGGVLNARGIVYMRGGGIIRNRGPWSAGGVRNTGFFYMYNGEISSNSGGLGGGVVNFVDFGSSGIFIMYNGKINNNAGSGTGGGVVNNSEFYMHGGEIAGNRADLGSGGGVYNGNSVYDEDGLFVITGGTIYGTNEGENSNIDNFTGGSIYREGGVVAYGKLGYYTINAAGDGFDFFSDNRIISIGIPVFTKNEDGTEMEPKQADMVIDERVLLVRANPIENPNANYHTTDDTFRVINGVLYRYRDGVEIGHPPPL